MRHVTLTFVGLPSQKNVKAIGVMNVVITYASARGERRGAVPWGGALGRGALAHIG